MNKAFRRIISKKVSIQNSLDYEQFDIPAFYHTPQINNPVWMRYPFSRLYLLGS